MEEISIHASEVPWQRPKDSPDGLRRKILRTGPDGKPRVALVKLEPGFEMGAHSHGHSENHYVLEGMYESQGREYRTGSYRFVPRHATHGPFRSHAGALMLVVWDT